MDINLELGNRDFNMVRHGYHFRCWQPFQAGQPKKIDEIDEKWES